MSPSVFVALLLFAGCAASVPARPARAPHASTADFAATAEALERDIAAGAEALRRGAVENRAVELASLRLAASGRDLIDAGSLDGAAVALERAISMWSRNGYARLYMAYVEQLQGRSSRAAELAASAELYLPVDDAVRAETERLSRSIRRGGAATGR